MADPRLNSVHLEGTRRDNFRRAREQVMGARGWQTVLVEQAGDADAPSSSQGEHTIIQNNNLAVPPQAQFWLVDKDYVYPLKVGLNTVGRSPDNDVVVPDGYVSRRHCAIVVHVGKGCELHDIASKNGTFINGNKLAGPTMLKAGDELRMSDRLLVFMTRDAAGPVADVGMVARTHTVHE